MAQFFTHTHFGRSLHGRLKSAEEQILQLIHNKTLLQTDTYSVKNCIFVVLFYNLFYFNNTFYLNFGTGESVIGQDLPPPIAAKNTFICKCT